MKRSLFPGLLLLLTGGLIALTPQFLLPVCEGALSTAAGAFVPMKCFWTARAELGAGALVAFGGLACCLSGNPAVRLGVAAATAGAALLSIALPAWLVGVCGSESMPCRMGTLPALVLLGGAGCAVSLCACLIFRRAVRQKGEPQ